MLAVALAAAGGVWYRVHQTRLFFEPHALLSRFPATAATVISADITVLRAAGLLDSAGSTPEPEYKQFLEGTGFDYRRDLDSLVASFSEKGSFFIARGRFDWIRLQRYALRQGGSCYQDLCRMQGSTPERHISFLPLRDDVLGLAVSTSDLAAATLSHAGESLGTSLPSDPVWISLPGSEISRQNALPDGLRFMLSALRSTDRILFTAGPAPSGIEARFETTCKTPDDAKVLASQLRVATSTLKEVFMGDGQTREDELAAAIASGSFEQTDRKVNGHWPLKKSLIALLTQGI